MIDLNRLPLKALYAQLSRGGLIERALVLARDEDLYSAALGRRVDVTSETFLDQESSVRCVMRARSGCVVAGLTCADDLLRVFESSCVFGPARSDGEAVAAGAALGTLTGPAREALALERTLLNLLSRLSGVATMTARFVETLEHELGPGSGAKLYDTRKTTPGLRLLEKYAVRGGGGMCHRIGLHDAVLVKDNHLARAGSEWAQRLGEAAEEARAMPGGVRFIEVEVDTLEQFERVLDLGEGVVDIVLLDNMTTDDLREAVRRRDERAPRLLLEASGGVRVETVAEIAGTGVDRVSAGALTQGAVCVDIGLDYEE